MKEIILNACFIIYCFGSCAILSCAMLYGFYESCPNLPWYLSGWCIFPLTILICASQQKCLGFFKEKGLFDIKNI